MTEEMQPDLYYESVKRLVQWGEQKTLTMNPIKTEEVILAQFNTHLLQSKFMTYP